eukprot:290730-Pleurochrysis_carterae.AAC.1
MPAKDEKGWRKPPRGSGMLRKAEACRGRLWTGGRGQARSRLRKGESVRCCSGVGEAGGLRWRWGCPRRRSLTRTSPR